MKTIDSIVTQAAGIARIRKDIHAHPELCFKEVRTADVVAKQLADWGIPMHRGMGTTLTASKPIPSMSRAVA